MPPPPTSTADLFGQVFSSGGSSASPAAHRAPQRAASIAPPQAPVTLLQSGLSRMNIASLLLKQLSLQGGLLGVDLARGLRLPYGVVDDVLAYLKDEKCIEVMSGEILGRASYRFNLTELGRRRAQESFEQCRYVGPAPVPLEAYVKQCQLQTVHGLPCEQNALSESFRDIILRPGLLDELGPAVCSGRSIFLFGPPGNGKTMVAKGLGKFLNVFGGEIYVPYAIQAENSIITVFDPTLHMPTDVDEVRAAQSVSAADQVRGMNDQAIDLRWRRIRRPVVMTGGELTLEMLDLRYNATANFYQAPLHVKANGGVFLIDDFGRQIVSPRELLNRWILPLEERVDYMTLATGKKFSVPFEQLIIFSTNLEPKELVDEAFLRRVKQKIFIGPPDRAFFREIFRFHCQQRRIPYHDGAVEFLFSSVYDGARRPRASDARDLLEIIQSICRYRQQEVALTDELLAAAAARFFCQM